MTTEELKAAVRKIRTGEAVPGVSISGDCVTDGETGKTYRVQGQERLRFTEVAPPVQHLKPAEPRGERASDSEQVCEECGVTFVKSKFNPYFTKCPSCRRKPRATGSEARTFTCSECGRDFTISKFQPYLTPDRCPICNRKAAHRRYMDGRRKVTS